MTKAQLKTLNLIRKLYKATTGKTLQRDLCHEQWCEAVDTVIHTTDTLREETLQALGI
jgi:hypothetical protein